MALPARPWPHLAGLCQSASSRSGQDGVSLSGQGGDKVGRVGQVCDEVDGLARPYRQGRRVASRHSSLWPGSRDNWVARQDE